MAALIFVVCLMLHLLQLSSRQCYALPNGDQGSGSDVDVRFPVVTPKEQVRQFVCSMDENWPQAVGLLSKIDNQTEVLTKRVTAVLTEHSPVVSELKLELKHEQLHSADLQLKLKEVQSYVVDLQTQLKTELSRSGDLRVRLEKVETGNRTTLLEEWRREFWKFTSQKQAETALVDTAKSGDPSLSRWLLEIGTNVDATDNDGHTSLHFAAEEGQEDVIRELIEGKAFLNARDKRRMTPLHYCAWRGRLNACSVLLKAGAALGLTSDDHRTPLHFAAEGGNSELAKLLIEQGSNINARDDREWTAMHYCAWKGHLDVCKLLVEKGAQLNARSSDKDWKGTPLTFAIKYNHGSIIQFLKLQGGVI